MIRLTPSARRMVRNSARVGTLFSALMLTLSVLAMLGPGRQVIAAGEFLGPVQFQSPGVGAPITGGGSANFVMLPPSSSACPGSASGTPSYRWQTYLVSSAVDVSSMLYTGAGPSAVPGAFVSPMYDAAQTEVINRNPAASPLGLIAGIPAFSFTAFVPPANLAAGSYNVGFACTLAGETVSYWMSQITIALDAADAPAGVAWTVAAAPTGTTTTLGATTTSLAATTTTARSATTTTVARTTTTTTAGSTTTAPGSTTTTVAGLTTTSVAGPNLATPTATPSAPSGVGSFVAAPQGGVGSSGSGSGSAAEFPVTGPSSAPTVIWAILLLVFGRMAILFARPYTVLPPTSR